MSSSILCTVYKIGSASGKDVGINEEDESKKEVPPLRKNNQLSKSLRRSIISGHLVDSV